jgi:hypothetical protein
MTVREDQDAHSRGLGANIAYREADRSGLIDPAVP